MKYKIYNTPAEFTTKCDEIIQSGICGNATQYTDVNACKHPTQNQWALPVLHYAYQFFDQEELIANLSQEWTITPMKA